MAALRDIARDFADEIRDGIGWVIIYRTGRSWHGVTVWSDVASDEWETDDINEALDVLKADPKAVLLNGYYCGHFAEDMTIDQIAAGIRWHYENGYNQLATTEVISGIVDGIEEARLRAAEDGLPFSDRLADGAEDEVNPYVYDGSMTLEDYEAMQAAREADRANDELAAVVRARAPNISEEAMQQILDAAGGLHVDPETMQRILDGFERITEALKALVDAIMEALAPVMEWAAKAVTALWEVIARPLVPPKWWHLYKHAKRARVRKKYRKRITAAVSAALAAAGGDTS